MRVDLAVATPAFIDVTYVGLEQLPRPGEERFARDLVVSPGGGAITAIGAARLGLVTALVAPLGADGPGALVSRELEELGVFVAVPRSGRTPVTTIMPVDGERAMVTFDPGARVTPAQLVALHPRAVVAGLGQLELVPDGALAYVSCGDDDARRHAGHPPASLAAARTLLLNRREAGLLTGQDDPEAAARALAEVAESVVLTLGPEGALAIVDGVLVRADGFDVGPVVDTTGAGDLLAAAWAWADGTLLEPEARLRWAVLYAALSVTVPTGAAGAVTLDRLIEEGTRRGLPAPPERSVLT
jgi:sugar/nucleoside kinase (ribokinase family)